VLRFFARHSGARRNPAVWLVWRNLQDGDNPPFVRRNPLRYSPYEFFGERRDGARLANFVARHSRKPEPGDFALAFRRDQRRNL
jgi:hypothetical protein